MKTNKHLTGMSRRFSRLLTCALIAVLAAASLSACGGTKKDANAEVIYFTNKLKTEVHNIYISPVDQEDWGNPLTEDKIKSGKTVAIDYALIGDPENYYDIGTIDENYMNYDLYEGLQLQLRDTIILEGTADSATYTIEHEDGTSETYDAYIYVSDDAQ